MSTIQQLGNHGMAGSKEYPTTYKIRACPKCYGVLYWMRKQQTKITCENCNTKVIMFPYKGPLDYTRYHIRKRLFCKKTIMLVLYGLCQVLDYRLKLRKLLLFAFIRGLSWL